jgi:hypothetical protein
MHAFLPRIKGAGHRGLEARKGGGPRETLSCAEDEK